MKNLKFLTFILMAALLVLSSCGGEEEKCEIDMTGTRDFTNKTEQTVEYYINGGYIASVKANETWTETLGQGKYAFEYRFDGEIVQDGFFEVRSCENTFSILDIDLGGEQRGDGDGDG